LIQGIDGFNQIAIAIVFELSFLLFGINDMNDLITAVVGKLGEMP